ncbi:transposase [Emticicia fluvialis]|uniref:transposase n=1 Tax=Emticicia fluvialis TaxID=2974474 RepID=UPI0021663B71|nr:transposase [Emticicia fluvialis]
MSADKFQNKYRIPSARHPHWDYGSNGIYFITVCTKNRQYFLGECKEGIMKLSTAGAIVQGFWHEIPKHFPFVTLGDFVVMPNHIHGILIFDKTNINSESNIEVETGHCPVSTQNGELSNDKTHAQLRFRNQGKNTVSSIIGPYKSICTKHIHPIVPDFEWQSRFWDNIIRDDKDFNTISQYIINNPLTWENDKLFGEQTENLIDESGNPDK